MQNGFFSYDYLLIRAIIHNLAPSRTCEMQAVNWAILCITDSCTTPSPWGQRIESCVIYTESAMLLPGSGWSYGCHLWGKYWRETSCWHLWVIETPVSAHSSWALGRCQDRPVYDSENTRPTRKKQLFALQKSGSARTFHLDSPDRCVWT